MRNNNRSAVRQLSDKSLKENRMRNVFAILAIALTCMLFTAAFSLVTGMMQVTQEQTMHEVGGRFHAGLKNATREQYEKVIADPLIKRSDYNIFIGIAENLLKRQTELRFLPEFAELSDYFIELEEGHMPEKEEEIVVDTIIMDELKVQHAVGEKIRIVFSFLGETIEKEFVVSGWYKGDSIGHASELFLSEAYWLELKGKRTDEDFITWGKVHPQDQGVGLYTVNLYFDNPSGLEEKVCAVISNAGYVPGTELDYGINWAYMQNRIESVDPVTFVLLGLAVLVILLTGYLIIYNIFQISVMNDIRFYGLLKTIGTTKKQLKALILRQALLLSLIGIPIGLILGYGIGKLALPFAVSFTETGNMKITLSFHPEIFLFSILFSALTVYLSCRKPGKIAGCVSPVEAVRYTEGGNVKIRAGRKSRDRKGNLFSMALGNLGRNRKKTAVVIAAVSLSMILLTIVATAVGSFRLDEYLNQRIVGDFLLGSQCNFSFVGSNLDFHIDPDYLELTDSQKGLLQTNEMYLNYDKSVVLDEKGKEKLQMLSSQGKLREDEFSQEELQRLFSGEQTCLGGYIYGYSDELLTNLTILSGTLDIEKFQSGDYMLLGQFLGKDHLPAEDGLYQPGDKVTVESSSGKKEYEVMAVVEIPYSMGTNRYSVNAMDIILPLREFLSDPQNSICFALSCQVEEAYQGEFEAVIKNYTENVNPSMGYASRNSLKQEFDGMVQVIAGIGISLAAVIAFIGILNYINAMITGIIARKRELAMLQSIGMTGKQLQKMLILEGISYVLFSGIISFLLGSLLARLVLGALNDVILFFEYRFQFLPFVVMLPLLLFTAVLTPVLAYRRLQKHSIVERLRMTE